MAAKRKQQDAQEKLVYGIVKKVIDANDPESLLKLGAPKDEYDSLSNNIAGRIVAEGAGGLNRTRLAYILSNAQHFEFHMWSEPAKIHGQHFDIADKLLPLLPKIRC